MVLSKGEKGGRKIKVSTGCLLSAWVAGAGSNGHWVKGDRSELTGMGGVSDLVLFCEQVLEEGKYN